MAEPVNQSEISITSCQPIRREYSPEPVPLPDPVADDVPEAVPVPIENVYQGFFYELLNQRRKKIVNDYNILPVE